MTTFVSRIGLIEGRGPNKTAARNDAVEKARAALTPSPEKYGDRPEIILGCHNGRTLQWLVWRDPNYGWTYGYVDGPGDAGSVRSLVWMPIPAAFASYGRSEAISTAVYHMATILYDPAKDGQHIDATLNSISHESQLHDMKLRDLRAWASQVHAAWEERSLANRLPETNLADLESVVCGEQS